MQREIKANMIEDKRVEILLAEYQAAHDSFHHYDGFRWQSGSLLIAGALVIWGFLLSNEKTTITAIGVTSLLISLIFTAWILYAHHYRQMYMTKLFRIHEIEKILSMKLNADHGFLGLTKSKFDKYGPKGHSIDLSVYVIVSLFGPLLSTINKNYSVLLLSSIPVILSTIAVVVWNEKRMAKSYEKLLKNALQ